MAKLEKAVQLMITHVNLKELTILRDKLNLEGFGVLEQRSNDEWDILNPFCL